MMKIVFMGTPNAAVPSLERILNDGHEIVAVYTQPDRPAGRGNKLTASPVKEFALQNNLQIFQPTKIKTAEALENFKSHNADVAVVVAYGRILPEGFLKAFPNGAINVHFSLLPKYRGAAPVNWAIVNGEEKTGVTTMKMDVGLDTGDILLVRETEIGADENAIELMQRLSFVGADLLSETLTRFDEVTPQTQNHDLATLAPIMRKEDGLIDWSLRAEEIVNRVRGFQPFPTSYTFYKGKKLTIWKASEALIPCADLLRNPSPAGTILCAEKDFLSVYCDSTVTLIIEELQLEGKRRMMTRDFLNGVKLQVGEKLG
ncbi:MAG TPA: methionyl-tRNA formyltransferase [Pyrinomonadaceae bacterium]|nr:methionyl-tRNA formyltransferase [Pyrinomonadaceae bacterium]